jgi:hypothetical protein
MIGQIQSCRRKIFLVARILDAPPSKRDTAPGTPPTDDRDRHATEDRTSVVLGVSFMMSAWYHPGNGSARVAGACLCDEGLSLGCDAHWTGLLNNSP